MILGYRHFTQASDYEFGCPDGAWTGRLDHKAWGKTRSMILYFSHTETGSKYWFSLFFESGYRPRDGGFDFKNDGHPGDVFLVTTGHTKTGNPVFQSAQRIDTPRQDEP